MGAEAAIYFLHCHITDVLHILFDRYGFGHRGLLFALFTSKKHSPPPWRPGRQGGRGGVGWVAGWLGGWVGWVAGWLGGWVAGWAGLAGLAGWLGAGWLGAGWLGGKDFGFDYI